MVYSNFFTSHFDATRSIGANSNLHAYSDQRWISRLEEFNKCILLNPNPSYTKKLPRSSSLPLFLSANANLKTVLDLGGGGGWLGLYIKSIYPYIKFYDLIEIDCVKDHFQNLLAAHGIRYVCSDNKSHYDIFYSNSCIQYFSSIDPLNALICNSSPKYIILDDVYLSQKEQFFCHQKYYKSTMVMSFVNYCQLTELMSKNGFSLCFSGIYKDPILGSDDEIPFDNSVPESWRPRERYSFIYKSDKYF